MEDVQASSMERLNVAGLHVQPTRVVAPLETVHIPFGQQVPISERILQTATEGPTDPSADSTQPEPSSFLGLVPSVGPDARNKQLTSHSSSSGTIGGGIGGVVIVLISVCVGLVVVLLWRRRRTKYVFESSNPVGKVTSGPADEGTSVNTVDYFGTCDSPSASVVICP